jgi:heat shock protein HtpX
MPRNGDNSGAKGAGAAKKGAGAGAGANARSGNSGKSGNSGRRPGSAGNRRSGGGGRPSSARRRPGSTEGSRGGRGGRGDQRGQAKDDAASAHPVEEGRVARGPMLWADADDSATAHRNRRRARLIAALPALLLFVVLLVVFSAIGALMVGVIVGAVVGAVVGVSLVYGATGVLLRSLRARPTDEDDLPGAYNLIEGLCASMGLPLPGVWLVDDPLPDALALGRGPSTGCLVLTSGLVDTLDPVALEGLLAHELTHIRRGDIAPATVAAALCLPLAVVVPGAGSFVHGLAGRGREFRTDQLAVGVTRYPPGLRQALSHMVGGPSPASGSPLSGRAVARSTRWLWTVALPVSSIGGAQPQATTRGTDAVASDPQDREKMVGELDAASVRIAALDEW